MKERVSTLALRVLRGANFPDCTNGGASARYDRIRVICDEGIPTEYDTDDVPADLFRLETDRRLGTTIAQLVPVSRPADRPIGPIAGGNYATTSDSRWGRYVSRVLGGEFRFVASCLPIYDRFETPEAYEALTR